MDDQITFCPNCGAFVEPDTVFCKNCGTPVKKTPSYAETENPVTNAPAMPPMPSSQPAFTPQQPPQPTPPQPTTAPNAPMTPPQPVIPQQQPEMPTYQPAPRKSNTGLIFGIIGGVVLLAIIGVGLYLFLDNDKTSSVSDYDYTEEIEETVYDYSDDPGADNVSISADDFSDSSGKTYSHSSTNYNFGSSDFENAFTKIYHDQLLTHSDIISLSPDELRILRNLPFAQAGRKFQSPELQEFFSQFDWYTPLYNDVSVNNLTANDRENINLIQKYE